jgi:hypothetical protein
MVTAIGTNGAGILSPKTGRAGIDFIIGLSNLSDLGIR